TDLTQNEQVRELIQAEVDKVNKTLAGPERVKRFAILPTRLHQEEGDVTPTLKVKRKAVMERFSHLVAALYDERQPAAEEAADADPGRQETAASAEVGTGRGMWTLPLSARPWTKFYPEGVPASLEYPEESLALPLLRAAREHPERTAMVYFNREISYGQLLDEVQRMAGALQSLGVRPGDRVGIMLPNTPQTVVAYYAVLWLGAVVVMVNPLYTPREMEILLKDSGATHLIALDVRFRDIEQVRPR